MAQTAIFFSQPKLAREARRLGLRGDGEPAATLAALAREPHPDVDHPTVTPAPGTLVRFERPLRFGVATADGDPPVRSFVFVDASPVGYDGVRPGLLLHGSPDHVPAERRPPDWERRPLTRTIGGTGPLLAWLAEADRRLDADPGFDPELQLGHAHAHPRHRGERVVQMYDLFARDGWMTDPGLDGIDGPVACRGLARVDFTAIRDDAAVVVASPLFVEAAVPAGEAGGDPTAPRRWRRLLRRPAR